jgi:methylmalonyl-CoA mutase N-terminal domain/subunit
LKEYIARGTYIYPRKRRFASRPIHLRLVRRAHAQLEHDLDLGLSHARSGARRQSREVAFTLANASPTATPRSRAACRSNVRRPPLFFFNGHSNFFERPRSSAPRAVSGRDRARALQGRDPELAKLRFHTQTAGLDADRAAARGERRADGARSASAGARRHASRSTRTPWTKRSASHRECGVLALRTQQVIAHETGVADTVDPSPARTSSSR